MSKKKVFGWVISNCISISVLQLIAFTKTLFSLPQPLCMSFHEFLKLYYVAHVLFLCIQCLSQYHLLGSWSEVIKMGADFSDVCRC